MTVVSQDGSDGPGFALGYDDAAGAWAFRVSPAEGTPLSWVVSGGAAPRQSWIHLLGVYDAERGSLRLYVNGRLVREDVQRGRAVATGAGGLQIGRAASASGYGGHLRGTVADVRAYDRVVPAPEAEELGVAKPHQVAYWPLESTTGGVAPDMDPKRPGEPAGVGLSLRGGASIYTAPDPGCDPGMDPDCVVDPNAYALWGNGHLALDGTTAYADRAAGLLGPHFGKRRPLLRGRRRGARLPGCARCRRRAGGFDSAVRLERHRARGPEDRAHFPGIGHVIAKLEKAAS
ncbi:LamG domain-containing protein [Streptomyces sparsogenes]|uniref:LamG domain-containing protein n=1 Tax=Streptomyces sparsogenes TaxID=67365 RepID=UPI0033D0FB67